MNCDLGILGIQNLIPIAAFNGIFEYSSNNIRICEPKIFEYSYSVHLIIANIFVFAFGPDRDPQYIHIHNRVKKNIPKIFIFIFGPKKNIRCALLLWQTQFIIKFQILMKGHLMLNYIYSSIFCIGPHLSHVYYS